MTPQPQQTIIILASELAGAVLEREALRAENAQLNAQLKQALEAKSEPTSKSTPVEA